MKQWLFLFLMTTSSCSLLQNNSFISRADALMSDHSFIYALPYQKGKSYLVIQGYESLFSHAGDFAIDFKMKRGTKVMAARGGIVVRVRDSTKTGGLGKKYVGTANGITIQHTDGTFGHYLHLQYKGAMVLVGDTIKQGQLIGLSGSTGFSAFPHLHFEVTRQASISRDDFPVLFQTKKGVKFLQPLHWYKAL
ncbi:MAG TPA: M23 family metallopeptidase [Flavisolibacter sp.]|jgi:murein DD-endopeptidase MepM/ murein hydrolase activator NlpD|nr:M23 family metallopeptidase [Flavisolibacter sp.]